jgi:hypothetical protein
MNGEIAPFKVVQRPRELDLMGHSGRFNPLYVQIIKSLEAMDVTKAIELAPAEIGNAPYINFKAYLKKKCMDLKTDFTPMIYFDKGRDIIFIWKRHKLGK